ncbi:MAG: hypothetical protein Q9171_001362 [Xanthocarpia ochracea]
MGFGVFTPGRIMPSYIQMPQTPTNEGLRTGQMDWMPPVPIIKEEQPLSEIVRELSQIVKSLFSNVEHDDRGVFQTRGFACEIVAWRFLTHLSEHELIDYLLTELPPTLPVSAHSTETEEAPDRPTSTRIASSSPVHERARLLFEDRTTSTRQPRVHEPPRQGPSQTWNSRMSDSVDDNPIISFAGLNALEIATIAGAKRFLSQYVVQQVIDGIWGGDIIFWESLSVSQSAETRFTYQIIDDTGIVGLAKQSAHIIEISFDILSLEALFLVPRVCSLLSLHPYFGTLVRLGGIGVENDAS